MTTQPKLNVKIAKTATQKSIMDVTASLDYRKVNNKNEDVFKGSIIFSITEIGSKKYEKAFVNKPTVKLLLHSMINHHFTEVYGAAGFTDFGGTVGDKPRARILNIKMTEKKQFVFTISEGPGKIGPNGSIQMVGKPEKSVQTYVGFADALKMAHEVYDYIRDEETKAMINGKPLYTIMPYQGPTKEEAPVKKEKTIEERLAEATETQLRAMYEKIKDSQNDKDIQYKTLIMNEVKRRKTKNAG